MYSEKNENLELPSDLIISQINLDMTVNHYIWAQMKTIIL